MSNDDEPAAPRPPLRSGRTSRPLMAPPPPSPPSRGALAVAADLAIVLAALAPLVATTVASFHADARLKWLLAALAAGQVVMAALLARAVRAGILAGAAVLTFAAAVSGSLLLPPADAPALALFGRGEGFWAAAVALAALGAFAALVCAWLPRAAWPVPVGAAALLGAGFAVAMGTGTSLAELHAGAATLAQLPDPYLQPSPICRYALPVCAVIALLFAGFGAGTERPGRAWAGLGVALLLALPVGPAYLVTARPATHKPPRPQRSPGPGPLGSPRPALAESTDGEGELRFTYLSAWDRNAQGELDHDVVVRTRGHVPGRGSTLALAACVRAPASADQPCRIQLACRTASGAVRTLTATDIDLFEDGEKLAVQKLERRGARDAHVYLVPLLHGDDTAYRERVVVALARMVTALPASMAVSIASHPYGKMKLTAIRSRVPTEVYEVLQQHTWYRSSDLEVPGLVTHLINQLDLEGVKDAERYFVAIAEKPIGKGGAVEAGTIAELRRAGTPVMAIGGVEGGPMSELARAVGGVHAPGRSVDEWSRGLDAVRLAIDHDYTLTYTRKRPPPPPVEIAKPAAGAVVRGPLAVSIRAPKGNPYGVEVALDDVPLGTLHSAPFELSADIAPFTAGRHELRATPVGPNGERGDTVRLPVELSPEAPQLECSGLPEGERLSSPATLEVRVRGRALSELTLTLDGATAISHKAPLPVPVKRLLDPAKLTDGPHEIKLAGTTRDGQKIEKTLSFTSRRRTIDIEVTSPARDGQVFGRVQIWVKPTPNWADGVVARMEASVTGGLVTDQKIGEVTAPPWLIPWASNEFAAGKYTIQVAVHTKDGVTGKVAIPVEVTRPAFSVELKKPVSGETITGPVPIEITVNDASGLGLDRVEFGAGGKLLEKKIQAPWTATLDPSAFEDGLVRVTVAAYRKDDAKAEASATVLYRRVEPVLVPVLVQGPAGPLPPSLLLGRTPQVTLAGAPPKSARFVSARAAPVHMVVVFPASRSTAEEGNLRPLLGTLSAFVPRVRAALSIGLVRYSDAVLAAADPLTPLGSLLECLRVPHPAPGRVLYDGLTAGAMALGAAPGRRVLVLIVDGPDANAAHTGAGSKSTGSESVKLLRSADVELHVIGFGRDLKLAPALEKNLGRLSALTGGSARTLTGAAGVAPALDAVRAHADAQVLLEIEPTVDQLKPGLHPLTIALPDEAGAKLIHRNAIHVK